MFNFPDGRGAAPAPAPGRALHGADGLAERDLPDITGSFNGAPARKAGRAGRRPRPASKRQQAGVARRTASRLEGSAMPTGAERAIFERLQQRREELDTRARELDIRESLIQSAEKRMDGGSPNSRMPRDGIKVETEQKNEAETARLKGLVTMYQNMKPRDAAKIFDRLEMDVLLAVASQINPRQMAEILAQMSPDVAEHLTVELASKAQQVPQAGRAEALPKIQGKPTAQ